MPRTPNPKVNGYKNDGRLYALAMRQLRAMELRVARSGRSDEEQLALLDKRPGWSSKERARLLMRIQP